MTLYRGPGGTGSATSDADTTLYQDFLNQTIAARDAALQAETNAELAETNAETAETNAETAATAAASSASAAASSASSASTSATNAASSASSASTSASNAASSASSASSSASAASTSATNAASSATAAASSASAASTSATNAANSATSASNSASTATTQATNAASSATAAASSATAAQSAQTAAEAARDAALSAYDNFDDRYLGPKSSDPTLDNDGNALIAGALYFNTATNVMKVYDGSAWVAAYVSAAGVLLAVNNLSDLSNTATARANLNVPTRTGGDASGTWGINISGNAATATTATNVSGGTASVTSVSSSGNLTFSGTGQRITGDFSNSTVANRVLFQTSTSNSGTFVGAIANGTVIDNTGSGYVVWANSDTTNSNTASLVAFKNLEARISSGAVGAASFVPLTFYTGGSERMRADTSGNVGIGTSSPGAKLDTKGLVRSSIGTGTGAGGAAYAFYQFGTSATATENWHIGSEGDGTFRWYNGNFGAGTERARIASNGQMSTTTGTGSVMAAYDARAWVNFNGTGTVAIRASGNVSSITDNGTGDYTVNFTTAMPDANYSIAASCTGDITGSAAYFGVDIRPTSTGFTTGAGSLITSSVRLRSRATGTADPDVFNVTIFR